MNRPAAIFSLFAATGALALAPLAAGAESFGRLFHTPAQRHALEQERQPAPPPPPRAEVPAPAAPLPQPLRIDGILRRSDGRYVLWIDGEIAPLPHGLQLSPGRQRALVPQDEPRRRLHVGDTWQAGAP